MEETNRYELTFKEIWPGDRGIYPYYHAASFSIAESYKYLIGDSNVPTAATALDNDSYVTQFKKYLIYRCLNGVMKVKYDEDFTNEEKLAKLVQVMYWLTATSVVHEKVLKAIDGIDDFMKVIESSDVTRFNDTPQSANPDEDGFTTTLTSSTHSEDGGTPLERLQEIKNLFDNELEIWCDEFVNTFIIM
jgi:hypothetical protein